MKRTGRMDDKLVEYIDEHKEADTDKKREDKRFPRAACVIDIVRASGNFETADQLMQAFDILEKSNGMTGKSDNGNTWEFELVRYSFCKFLINMSSELPDT